MRSREMASSTYIPALPPGPLYEPLGEVGPVDLPLTHRLLHQFTHLLYAAMVKKVGLDINCHR